jgi:hypothetical protein
MMRKFENRVMRKISGPINSSHNRPIVRAIKLERTLQATNIACKVLKLHGKRPLVRSRRTQRIILKWILGCKLWTRFNCAARGSSGGLL